MVALVPQGLTGLYAKSSHQAVVQATIVAARECTIIAQQQQRSIQLGTQDCPLPENPYRVAERELYPVFHADGTASHTAHIVVEGEGEFDDATTVIVIEKLTANVSVRRDAQAK